MTTITDTQTAAPAPPSTAQASSGALSSDFDTFLSLLTAQIRNQDPLEPADGTQFVAQLATFSNVEQSVRTNELLEDMARQLGQQDVSSAVGWIGMDVRHAGPIAGDAPVQTLHASIPAIADAADLVVTDSRGREIRRQAVDPDADTFAWPGPAGPLPPGSYNLQIEPHAGDQPLPAVAVSHFGTVREVSLTEVGPTLRLADGTQLPADQLLAIRAPLEE